MHVLTRATPVDIPGIAYDYREHPQVPSLSILRGDAMSTNAEPWRLQLFGPWTLMRGQQPVRVTLRQQRVIAALALFPRRRRLVFAEQLWPDSPNGLAAGNLRAALWHIRHDLPGLLDRREEDLRLSASVRVDVDEFRARLRAIGAPDWVYDPELLRLSETAELLPGWYEEWLAVDQERIRQQRVLALHSLCGRLLDAGDAPRALDAASLAVSIEPLSESSQTLLLQAQLASGDYAAAVRTFGAFGEMLDRELGVGPSRRMLRMLYQTPAGATGVTAGS